MQKILFIGLLIMLNIGLVYAQEHDFAEIKELIDSGISCDKLTEEQLEGIGEYYMEQMHPGEAHEMMDKMMGGEGSESLRQMHIAMARRLNCNEDIGGMMNSGGMMNMMMGGNMMGNNMMQSGMMGNGGYSGYWNFLNVLYVILLIELIILVYLWIVKLLKNKGGKK
ncbi:MAG: hypothetical protein AABY07_08790 [Nanoarchaeota archaeon]